MSFGCYPFFGLISGMRFPFPLVTAALLLVLSGCATYSANPLPEKNDLNSTVPAPGAPALDMDAVATVAVLNNPDLKAARAKARVAGAQAFAAGLLPNPQLTANLDHPTDHDVGLVNGYGLGLSYDLQALLTHPAAAAAANAARDQAELDLLWQEWQTVAQARTLYVQNIIATEKHGYLADAEQKYAAQAERSGRALQAGDITIDQAGTDLAVLLDIRSQLGEADRSALQADRSLHSLLGVAPDVRVPLQTLGTPEIPDRMTVDAALARLPQSRPDLRALQAGYRSQDELLFKAVLSQFPNISLGFTKARDTSDVHTTGFGVTLDLPLFDQGEGEIAIQNATRDQLRAEYQARLDQATGDAWRLWTEMQQLKAEIEDIEARLPQFQMTVDAVERSYQAGDLAVPTYFTMLNTLLTRQTELFDLKQSLWSDALALSSVLGTQVEPQGVKDSKP